MNIPKLRFSNWLPNEPNDFATGEDCAVLSGSTPGRKWNDVPCNDKAQFICKIPLPTPGLPACPTTCQVRDIDDSFTLFFGELEDGDWGASTPASVLSIR